jgi:hypothetical protein
MQIEITPHEFGENYLWKFIDIHKFLYFINEKRLHFTRLDKLEDPNEGLPENLIRQIYENELFPVMENLNSAMYPTLRDKAEAIESNQIKKNQLISDAEEIQQIQYANCWFLGNRESYAMWNLYSNPDSIAIRIRPKELIECVEGEVMKLSDSHINKIVCGKMSYNRVYPPEYEMEKYQKLENKYSAFKKDSSYEYESEYRFIAVSATINDNISKFEIQLEDLHNLDFKILTHPKMENWMYDNIRSILKNLDLTNKLMKSEIKLKPSR